MTVLAEANRQWSVRPADESYPTLQALHDAVLARTERAKETSALDLSTVRATAEDGDVKLIGRANIPASFTHWSFGQLARLVKAPADYLRELPATLAVQNLNHGLARRDASGNSVKLLLDVNGHSTLRAITGPDYARIWDQDITHRLLQLKGWNPAPETQLANGGVTRGLYASDHDVFAFLVDNDRRVFESLPGGGLSRGFMVANSEVGDKAFWIQSFLYSYICGNHNIWGVTESRTLRIRHVGKATTRAFWELTSQLRDYANASATETEGQIRQAMTYRIAATKDELLDKLFNLKSIGLSRKLLAESYDAAEKHVDWYGDPRTAWGVGNGITEVARAIPYADERVKVERAAGKVFEMAF